MKDLISKLRQDIHNCGIDSRYEDDNFSFVSDAIATLDKIEAKINYTQCCDKLCECKKHSVKTNYGFEVCTKCGNEFDD